jgi:hypothetical protein
LHRARRETAQQKREKTKNGKIKKKKAEAADLIHALRCGDKAVQRVHSLQRRKAPQQTRGAKENGAVA